MKYDYIITDGVSTISFVPLNEGSIKIKSKRDTDNGQIFFRKTISDIIMVGEAYEFLLNKLLSGSCEDITIYVYNKCDGSELYKGIFSAQKIVVNLNRCTIQITPEIADKYSCLLKQYKKEMNVLGFGIIATIGILPVAVPIQPVRFGTEIYEGRRVQKLINQFLLHFNCNVDNVVAVNSNFFEWGNIYNDIPTYVPGQNYVTQTQQVYNTIDFVHVTNIINYPASAATIYETSLFAILELLRKVFNVWWDIDDNGFLRLEHISFFTNMLPNKVITNKVNELKFSVVKPKKIQIESDNNPANNWAGLPLEYTNICNKEIEAIKIEKYTLNYTWLTGTTLFDADADSMLLCATQVNGGFDDMLPQYTIDWYLYDFYMTFYYSGGIAPYTTIFGTKNYIPIGVQKRNIDVTISESCSCGLNINYNYTLAHYNTILNNSLGIVYESEYDLRSGQNIITIGFGY